MLNFKKKCFGEGTNMNLERKDTLERLTQIVD